MFQRTLESVKLPSEIIERTICTIYDHMDFHVLLIVSEIILTFLKFGVYQTSKANYLMFFSFEKKIRKIEMN
jgi:hypothetical protein